jgi:hypothetical protein
LADRLNNRIGQVKLSWSELLEQLGDETIGPETAEESPAE